MSVDQHNLHMVYRDNVDSKEYYFLLGKDFTIQAVVELEVPELVGTLANSHWFELTYSADRSPRFAGEAWSNGEYYAFNFDTRGKVTLTKSLMSLKPVVSDKIKSLIPEVNIEHMISRKGQVFVTGYDTDLEGQVFVRIKTTDEGELYVHRQYHLKHGFGEIKVNTIALDQGEGHVYLGGDIAFYENDRYVCSEFFIEQFGLY